MSKQKEVSTALTSKQKQQNKNGRTKAAANAINMGNTLTPFVNMILAASDDHIERLALLIEEIETANGGRIRSAAELDKVLSGDPAGMSGEHGFESQSKMIEHANESGSDYAVFFEALGIYTLHATRKAAEVSAQSRPDGMPLRFRRKEQGSEVFVYDY